MYNRIVFTIFMEDLAKASVLLVWNKYVITVCVLFQADILHAYHVLRNHGFPPENIVTMMYDDIADNAE